MQNQNISQNTYEKNHSEAESLFQSYLESFNLAPDVVACDGDRRYCTAKTGKNAKNKKFGWYALTYAPTRRAYIGTFGNFSLDNNAAQHWTFQNITADTRTPEQVRADAARDKQAQAARAVKAQSDAAAKMTAQAAALLEINHIWHGAKPRATHPYLEKKGVKGYGLKIDRRGRLLIPYSIGGKLATLQTIDAAGNKLYYEDGVKKGAYHVINPNNAPLATACAVEGYATGASIFEAFNLPVVVCGDSPGIVSGVTQFRRDHPENVRILHYTDNDQFKAHNAGIDTAKKLKAAFPGVVTCKKPDFESLEGEPTDFNDLHQREGLQAVRRYHPDNAYGTELDAEYCTYQNYITERLDLRRPPFALTFLQEGLYLLPHGVPVAAGFPAMRQ